MFFLDLLKTSCFLKKHRVFGKTLKYWLLRLFERPSAAPQAPTWFQLAKARVVIGIETIVTLHISFELLFAEHELYTVTTRRQPSNQRPPDGPTPHKLKSSQEPLQERAEPTVHPARSTLHAQFFAMISRVVFQAGSCTPARGTRLVLSRTLSTAACMLTGTAVFSPQPI